MQSCLDALANEAVEAGVLGVDRRQWRSGIELPGPLTRVGRVEGSPQVPDPAEGSQGIEGAADRQKPGAPRGQEKPGHESGQTEVGQEQVSDPQAAAVEGGPEKAREKLVAHAENQQGEKPGHVHVGVGRAVDDPRRMQSHAQPENDAGREPQERGTNERLDEPIHAGL